MQRAIRLDVTIGADHVIRVPEDVPVGPAEVIILLGAAAARADRLARARELLESCPAQSTDSAQLVAQDRLR
jgi:hypothetical protein